MKKVNKQLNQYLSTTRSSTYGFIAALPLLILYETLIIATNTQQAGAAGTIRVGADIWLKSMLWSFGVTEHLSLGVFVLMIGGGIAIRERNKKIKIQWHYFYWMFMESILYSIVLAVIIAQTVALIFPNPDGTTIIHFFSALRAGGMPDGRGLQLALSIGAGLYEELFFRVLLVGGFYMLLGVLIGVKRNHAYVAAAILAALIFSSVHYIGAYGDTFTWGSFTFRFLFGLALNALYLLRGFGIAAWAHSIYDVLLTLTIGS